MILPLQGQEIFMPVSGDSLWKEGRVKLCQFGLTNLFLDCLDSLGYFWWTVLLGFELIQGQYFILYPCYSFQHLHLNLFSDGFLYVFHLLILNNN